MHFMVFINSDGELDLKLPISGKPNDDKLISISSMASCTWSPGLSTPMPIISSNSEGPWPPRLSIVTECCILCWYLFVLFFLSFSFVLNGPEAFYDAFFFLWLSKSSLSIYYSYFLSSELSKSNFNMGSFSKSYVIKEEPTFLLLLPMLKLCFKFFPVALELLLYYTVFVRPLSCWFCDGEFAIWLRSVVPNALAYFYSVVFSNK